MKIISFKNFNYTIINDKDNTERDIGYSQIKNCIIVGRNYFNPNVLLYDSVNLISPYDEKVMSLNKDSFYDDNEYEMDEKDNINNKKYQIKGPVFFFIYNFDNYYHFLYDTLPYLYTYLKLKKNIQNLKLLVNYPNKYSNNFYKFNREFLEKIIDLNDLIVHKEDNIYESVYISSSLTHGGYSNNPPRKEIFTIYNIIKSNTPLIYNLPKLIYISRRTWLNPDKSNIGTDYTTRRKMINEDELVNYLESKGFVEIFAENLSTDEKINLFDNAEIIIGSIGGGMANLLFSKKTTKSIVLVTPYFLEINYRFKYSLENTNITYFNDITTYKKENKIPLYCRVTITDEKSNNFKKIGEIVDYNNINNEYLINISNNDIVGFNNNLSYIQEYFNEEQFKLLDKGLNSPYIVDLNRFSDII
jgi:hypothetical protein